MEDNLTAAQRRILEEVREAGRRVYNGRADRPVSALEEAGLVVVEREWFPAATGNGMELRQRITVRPAPTG